MAEITDDFERRTLLENLTPLLADGEEIVFTCYDMDEHPVVVTTTRLVLVEGAIRDWLDRDEVPGVGLHWLTEVTGIEMPVVGTAWRAHMRHRGHDVDRQPGEVTLLRAHAEPLVLKIEGLDTAVALQRAIATQRH